jgi:hypothetical protein
MTRLHLGDLKIQQASHTGQKPDPYSSIGQRSPNVAPANPVAKEIPNFKANA